MFAHCREGADGESSVRARGRSARSARFEGTLRMIFFCDHRRFCVGAAYPALRGQSAVRPYGWAEFRWYRGFAALKLSSGRLFFQGKRSESA